MPEQCSHLGNATEFYLIFHQMHMGPLVLFFLPWAEERLSCFKSIVLH